MAAVLYGVCAVVYGLLAGLVAVQARGRRTGLWLAACCTATAAWAGSAAATGEANIAGVSGGLDLIRALCGYGFILHLYRRSVPDGGQGSGQGSGEHGSRSSGQAGATFRAIGLVAALVVAAGLLLQLGEGAAPPSLWSFGIAARMGLAICQLLLIENLYLNTPVHARWHVALPCVTLGALAGFDILLCADAVLFRQASLALFDTRAIVTALVAPLLVLAAARDRRWNVEIHVSRTAVFHSATLLLSGIFILGLAAAGEVFRQLGGDWGRVAKSSLVFAGVIALGLALTSGTARGRMRALVVEHFFAARFDYRREWLRCIATLSAEGGPATGPATTAAPGADAGSTTALHARIIRAVADVVDCPAGLLFLRDAGESAFGWAGSWNMPAVPAPVAAAHPLVIALQDGEQVVVFDPALRAVPPLDGIGPAWLAVPLATGGWLAGFILVAPPRAPFRLDQEVFELLRIVGREVACFLAEQRATQVMVQTRQLHDYGKRFAFVAHDIKNVSSQLSLLLSNAENHMQNPEFQRDVLATVQASVQKISHLIKRLEAPDADTAPTALAPLPRLEAIVATFRRLRPTEFTLEHDGSTAAVAMSPDAFDTVVTHLLNNAAEAGGVGPVRLRVRHEARRVVISITDNGPGMTAEFVRDELFRPFATRKREGTGIGAFQARELMREAGGDLVVDSRPGDGTTVGLLLTRADAPAAQAAFA